MKILVIAQIAHQQITKGTLSAIQAAQAFKKEVDVCLIGFEIADRAKELTQYQGVAQVLQIDNVCYEHTLVENVAIVIAELAHEYTHILAPASAFGKSLLPRVAALKGVAQVSNVIEIVNEDTVVHSIYAGHMRQTVHMLDPLKVMTLDINAFPIAKKMQTDKTMNIKSIDLKVEAKRMKWISRDRISSKRPELNSAALVLSGGRGFKNQDEFTLLEEVADKLNAAIAGSKALVDAGFISTHYQVGQAGKKIAPDLYMAFGISGAIQHIAGIKDARVIVAINNDPNAAIFQIADYGLVAEVVPVLIQLKSLLS